MNLKILVLLYLIKSLGYNILIKNSIYFDSSNVINITRRIQIFKESQN